MISFEVVTVGIPFALFKIITGTHLNSKVLMGWGSLDLLINLINLISLLISHKRLLEPCLASYLTRQLPKLREKKTTLLQDFGNSIDTLLSFAIVAFMIGSGSIPTLSKLELNAWNMSVILNVLGAGFSRFSSSLKNLQEPK